MPSLRDLLNNLPNFQYYSGVGNFTANNLPYGQDRPNGGSSREPYVIRDVGSRWSPTNVSTGIPPFGTLTTLNRAGADLQRITKFLTDLPQGPLWLGKQVGLQRMNVETSKLQGLDSSNSTDGGNRITGNFSSTRLYNPLGLTTLAQVGVSGTGIHFTRHGLLPKSAGNIPPGEKYESIAKNLDRLNKLTIKFTNPDNALNFNNSILYSYKGGPNSFLGIGDTVIKRTARSRQESVFGSITSTQWVNKISIDNGNNSFGILSNGEDPIDVLLNGFVPLPINELGGYTFGTVDFRATKNAKLTNGDGSTVITNTDYTTLNTEDRIGIIKSRYRSKKDSITITSDFFGSSGSLADYSVKGPTDMVNSISLYRSSDPKGDLTTPVNDINGNIIGLNNEMLRVRDMIKFRIKSFDNDAADQATGAYMVFRAFIDSFSNNMNSEWTPYTYVGRGEKFHIYEGFTETYSLGFTIAAFSRSEMKPLYQKLNYLKSTMAPDYKNNKMRGNISELTVGDYIHYQPGIITDLSISVPQEANWEIAIDFAKGRTGPNSPGRDEDMHELPQLLKVTMNFIPIYRFLPKKGEDRPFIGINDYRTNFNSNNIDPTNPREWLRKIPVNK